MTTIVSIYENLRLFLPPFDSILNPMLEPSQQFFETQSSLSPIKQPFVYSTASTTLATPRPDYVNQQKLITRCRPFTKARAYTRKCSHAASRERNVCGRPGVVTHARAIHSPGGRRLTPRLYDFSEARASAHF